MPGVLANEHRRSSPGRVERTDLVTSLDESLLIEQPISRQKVLPVHVPHIRCAFAECYVQRAVVERAAPPLVEADYHVERARRTDGGAIGVVQVSNQRSSGHRQLTDAALQEISG